MTLETTFQQLGADLLALHEALVNLRTTVREDKPPRDDVVLVDLFGDAADDLLGLTEEGLATIRGAQSIPAGLVGVQQLSQALAICHERHHQVSHRCTADLLGYERIRELRRFGRRRGGEWRAWSQSVKAALESCQQPIFAVDGALLSCWRELTERGALASVSLRVTSVGQHIAPLGCAAATSEATP